MVLVLWAWEEVFLQRWVEAIVDSACLAQLRVRTLPFSRFLFLFFLDGRKDAREMS